MGRTRFFSLNSTMRVWPRYIGFDDYLEHRQNDQIDMAFPALWVRVVSIFVLGTLTLPTYSSSIATCFQMHSFKTLVTARYALLNSNHGNPTTLYPSPATHSCSSVYILWQLDGEQLFEHVNTATVDQSQSLRSGWGPSAASHPSVNAVSKPGMSCISSTRRSPHRRQRSSLGSCFLGHTRLPPNAYRTHCSGRRRILLQNFRKALSAAPPWSYSYASPLQPTPSPWSHAPSVAASLCSSWWYSAISIATRSSDTSPPASAATLLDGSHSATK
mmetsp:Transcript_13939/g.26720  ORF Transcript_13939/g.26720 Transcript_13939/m.26720 type:complete len:273 (+) Transcript_13939:117-935(+)